MAPGEAHALVGRNGAGKSTLVSILTGLARPDSGQVQFDGQPAPPLHDRGAWRRRVACVYQKSTIIPTLSVAENLYLNRQVDSSLRAISWRRLRVEATQLLSSWGIEVNPQTLAGDLQGEAERQLGELGNTASQLSSTMRLLSDSLGTELKQRAEEALQLFQSRSEQVWQELAVRAEQRIAETARTCTADLAKQARQVVDQEMSAFLSQALRRFERSSDTPPSNENT